MELIVAKSKNGVIGRDGKLPWHLPGDLKWFKQNTLGKPVIMGRKTHESIGRILSGRLNVVLTGNRQYQPLTEDIICIHDVVSAHSLFRDWGVVIGGAEVYKLLLPFVTKMYVTEVDVYIDGDTFFPDTSFYQWTTTYEERKVENGIRYKLMVKERVF